jgi:hypothetical protein
LNLEWLAIPLYTILLASCTISVPGEGSTTHHLIIGIGVVSIDEPKEKALLTTDVQALGISVSDRPGLKLGIGYSSATVVSVAENAEDVRVEVSKKAGGSLIVDTQSAILRKLQPIGRQNHDHDLERK